MLQVICAVKAVRGDSEKTTLYDNEALVIKGVIKSKFKGKKTLKVYSRQMKIEKVLPEDFVGVFTTLPYLCRLYLAELMEHVPNFFPGKAILYLDTKDYYKPQPATQVPGYISTITVWLQFGTSWF